MPVPEIMGNEMFGSVGGFDVASSLLLFSTVGPSTALRAGISSLTPPTRHRGRREISASAVDNNSSDNNHDDDNNSIGM